MNWLDTLNDLTDWMFIAITMLINFPFLVEIRNSPGRSS